MLYYYNIIKLPYLKLICQTNVIRSLTEPRQLFQPFPLTHG